MEEAPPWYTRTWEDKRRERLTTLLTDAGIPRTPNPRDDVEGFYISPAAAEGGYLYRVAYCVPDALPDATERRASGIARCETAIRAALYSIVESGAPEEAFFTVYVDGGDPYRAPETPPYTWEELQAARAAEVVVRTPPPLEVLRAAGILETPSVMGPVEGFFVVPPPARAPQHAVGYHVPIPEGYDGDWDAWREKTRAGLARCRAALREAGSYIYEDGVEGQEDRLIYVLHRDE